MGYFNRVKGAFAGAIFGLILVPVACFLLAWNERDAVRQTGAITEIEKVAVADVPASPIDPTREQQLIHVKGECITEDILENQELAIREQAIRLNWNASIYQWTEKEHKKDRRTEYEYKQQWVDAVVDSNRFHHQFDHSNEGSVKHFHDGQEQAKHVQLGEFRLTESLIRQIGNAEHFSIPEAALSDIRPSGQLSGGVFYTGDPNQPQIGDEKIEVTIVGPRQDVTVLAVQQDRSFAAYPTKVGITKEILYMGLLSKAQVIDRQRFEAAMKRWLIRGGGFVAMWIGLALILSPMQAVLSGIPLLGRMVGGAISIVTFLIALVLSTITIAVAWFVVRPVLSMVCLVVAAGCLFLLFRKKPGDSPSSPPPPPPSVPPPLPS